MKKVNLSGDPFHFIGIGGIGMSALAHIIARRQLPVSGSDVRANNITKQLESLGVKVFPHQEAKNLQLIIEEQAATPSLNVSAIESARQNPNSLTETDLLDSQSNATLPQIVCSTAIAKDNPEYQEALKLGYPIFHRSDILAALIDEYYSIAVSGTHGKTTTSSLLSYLLLDAGLDPTIIVGGEVDAWQGNARAGEGKYLVAEADESDGSLIKHSPQIGIITNIELDHPDRYQSLDRVIEVFQTFANQCEIVIGCLDDEVVRQKIELDISYSLDSNSNADYIARNIKYGGEGTQAEIWERGELLGTIQLQILGHHNLSNALSAIAVGRKIGLEFPTIARGLGGFAGTKRRFELKGTVNQIEFIDDYAHHPKEVAVTLAAAKLRIQEGKNQRAIAIFQPHRYSRMATFMTEFANSLQDADVIVITDIYSAGETNVYNISGQQLADTIGKNHARVYYQPNLESLPDFLQTHILQPGDLVLFLGAGNLNQYISKTIKLSQKD